MAIFTTQEKQVILNGKGTALASSVKKVMTWDA